MDNMHVELIFKNIETIRTYSDERFDKIEEKLDKLLRFKWQIIGGSLVASTVLSIAFQIVLEIINK